MEHLDFILDRTLRPISGEAYGSFLLKLLLLLTLIALSRWMPRSHRYRQLVIIALCYGSFHILIYSNPIFLTASYHLLSAKTLEVQKKDAMRFWVSRHWKIKPTEYLAVGSSQTGAIYNQFADESPRLDTLAISGMGPLDFNLYLNDILRRAPKTVILTLSEFDFNRRPSASAAKTSPRQSLRDLAEILQISQEISLFSSSEITDFLLAQVFIDYRLQYLFKGYRRKLTLFDFVEKEDHLAESNSLRMQRLFNFSAEWFDANEQFIRRFIAKLGQHNINVILVEGHYHPESMAKNQALHQKAISLLQELSSSFPHVRYLPLPTTIGIEASDYRDPYHIKRETGAKLTRAIIAAIEQVPNRKP